MLSVWRGYFFTRATCQGYVIMCEVSVSEIEELKKLVTDTNKIVKDIDIRLTTLETTSKVTAELREENADLKNKNLQIQIDQNKKDAGTNNKNIVNLYEENKSDREKNEKEHSSTRRLIFSTWGVVALSILGVVLDKVF
jgi:hypothetical protein